MRPLLSLRDVCIAFDRREPVVKGVSCDVWAGATTCIVGESGSGKTLTSLAVMGLLPGSGTLVSERIHRVLNGLHVMLDSLVQSHHRVR